jgi:selenocysteine lyase
MEKIKCDYLVLAGHKFYGPRIGALYARDPSLLQPMLFGGGQERSLRPGTENTPMIVGLGACIMLLSLFHILFCVATI